MKTPTTLAIGDSCPACSGELRAARVPTDDEFRKAFDKENPISLAPGTDTANADQRAELGALYRCTTCRYQTRFKDAGEASSAEGEGEGNGKPAGRRRAGTDTK